MVDLDPNPELKGPTVAGCANQCLESFQQCLISASSVHPREVSMVEDQLARFSSWASSIGVFAPGSASMDHRLRYASEVQSVVTGLLESLNYRVQTCSKSLAQLADSSTADASTTANDRLAQSFLDIAAEITRLNKISNTIRRASKDTQALKASNFQIKDDEGENAEPLLLSHFEHHIGDWFPGISETIRQRLARAMLLRRKRILYRRHRQGNSSIRSENTISQASVTLPDAQPGAVSSLQTPSQKGGEKAAINRPSSKLAPSQVKSATTLAPEKFKMVSSSPSVVSASRTIASGKHQVLTYPPAPGFAAKRRYEKLKSQRIVEAAKSTELGLRELLESDLQAIGEITCPYCLYALPAAEVFDERKWQNHVKNDLDPYVCLFEGCDQSDVLYTHSDEWLNHLHQHGKVWWCSSHREIGPFSALGDYMKHMREVHNTKLSDRQLRVVANRNSRKTVKLFPSCPLCGREESEVDGRLEDHLAGHLRSLALKSLPSYQDEIPGDVGGENNSIDGSRPRSRTTIREMEEEDEEMLPDGAGNFWDQWNRQLSYNISTTFLGDVYFELDLGDDEARAASLFFDSMVFKESSKNLDDDPILRSMLQQQLARIEVIDSETDDSSGLSVDQEMATSSKAPVDETSGQAEVDNAISQEPVNVEPLHAQTTTPAHDTEVEIREEEPIPETLFQHTTQGPPATEVEIPADPESVNLSDPPMDETSRQNEVDTASAPEPVDAEAAHVQAESVGTVKALHFEPRHVEPRPVDPVAAEEPSTVYEYLRIYRKADGEAERILQIIEEEGLQDRLAYWVDITRRSIRDREGGPSDATRHAEQADGRDVEAILSGGSKGSESELSIQSRPGSESGLLALPELAGLPPGIIGKAFKLAKNEKEAMQHIINARRTDAEAVAAVQTVDGVDEGDGVNEENTEYPIPKFYEAMGFPDMVEARFRHKPEVYEEFIDILRSLTRDQTPFQDVKAQISALLESAPDLVEEWEKYPPLRDPSTKPGSQTKPDVRPKDKDRLCENVLIDGHCRNKDQGCEFNHDDDTASVSQTQPPGAPLIDSMSPDEKDDPPARGRERKSGVYINGEKVMDLKRQERPLTKHQSSSSSLRKVPRGSSSSQVPPGLGVASEHQESSTSPPQAWNASIPRDGKAVPQDLRWANIPRAQEGDLEEGDYHPYPLPQSAPFPPPPSPSNPYPDDAFEADVEEYISRRKNARRRTRPAVYYNGKYSESGGLPELSRENSPGGSRRERIVIVDRPPAPHTAPSALPYSAVRPRPVIVDERPRPRVEIEIVDGSRPTRQRRASDVPSSTRSLNEESTHPRHTSHDPRSVHSMTDEYARRRRRRRDKRQVEEEMGKIRARINKANAEISDRPPVPVKPLSRSSYRWPAVQAIDPEADPPSYIRWGDIEREEEAPRPAAKEEGQENGPSVGEFDREEELIKAVLRLEAEQERYKEEARRLSQKEEGKGKGNEGEGKQPEVKFPNREAELREALRQLKSEQDRLGEKARRGEMDEREAYESQRRYMMDHS